jgi:hypothetical protein
MPGSTRPTQFGRIYPPDEAWLARQPPEPVLDADLPIVDTHHHLWERPDHTMKLGGMMMRLAAYDYRTQPGPPSSAELATLWRPYIEPCIEAVRGESLHVREQLPGGEDGDRMGGAVERVQAHCRRSVPRREAGALQRHGAPRLSARLIQKTHRLLT